DACRCGSARTGGPARLGSSDGVRLRRLLRLRRGDRRRDPAAMRRGPGPGCRGGRRMNILNASGCLDALTAPAVARSLDAFVTKTVTPLPREGNAPPRIAEVEHGMLNSIGLANPGIDRFLAHTLPRLGELGVPVWVSVGAFAVADYPDLCDRLDDRPEVDAIELNVSCPNVDDVPAGVGEIVAASRAATRKPLYTKLSPATADIAEVARAAQQGGTDGLSLVNTILGLALDERTLKPRLSRG